ncbi:MerR family transcriptional regulator [Oscillibacter sp.]|uniref:MerR family transcriptional regulator n=1 Tax=Oscillibacter sp. TaxID=1945593 RepID=UPI00261F20B9|nr:MerR family transcriptional regulator [Oscillibacter sp.]MDD3347121.1 MerR family transcriptional regulator [Oscillibacter sp.]
MTIAQVSRQYGLSADTLRYYERIGLIPPVPRNNSGIRDYDTVSCQWIELMKCMRSAGVQIEALIEYVALFQQGDATLNARRELLIAQREQLKLRMADMQASLDRLESKIEHYEQGLMPSEQRLRSGISVAEP